jgi:hypothetical protein
MATTREALWGRINSLCVANAFIRAHSAFDFDTQPTTLIDGAFRITVEAGPVIGGIGLHEERTDLVTIWVARKHAADPQVAYESGWRASTRPIRKWRTSDCSPMCRH